MFIELNTYSRTHTLFVNNGVLQRREPLFWKDLTDEFCEVYTFEDVRCLVNGALAEGITAERFEGLFEFKAVA